MYVCMYVGTYTVHTSRYTHIEVLVLTSSMAGAFLRQALNMNADHYILILPYSDVADVKSRVATGFTPAELCKIRCFALCCLGVWEVFSRWQMPACN